MKFPYDLVAALALLVLTSASCSSSPPAAADDMPPPRLTSATTPARLSLKTACALAVNHHPSLATYPMDRRAADARILQASRIPNPILNVDDEDFFGTGDLGGLSASVLNSLLTQVIERGGKRQARTEAARKKGQVMDAEYEIRRLEVMQETGELYLDAVAARENLIFLEKVLARSQETERLATRLLDAGRVTKDAFQQARLEAQKARLAVNQARQASARAAHALTAQWGDSRRTQVTYPTLGSPPIQLASSDSLRAGLTEHPRMRHSLARVAQSDALLKLAEADKLGNLTLGGGVRHASASDELSGLAAISFPIPVFDRREDAIAEMTALAEKARLELDGTRRELETEFTLAWSDLIAAHQAARLIQTELLPASTEAFHSAEKSFRGGKITALEYLAARQQFQDIRRQWLDARREFHLAATRVQTLTGRSL